MAKGKELLASASEKSGTPVLEAEGEGLGGVFDSDVWQGGAQKGWKPPVRLTLALTEPWAALRMTRAPFSLTHCPSADAHHQAEHRPLGRRAQSSFKTLRNRDSQHPTVQRRVWSVWAAPQQSKHQKEPKAHPIRQGNGFLEVGSLMESELYRAIRAVCLRIRS